MMSDITDNHSGGNEKQDWKMTSGIKQLRQASDKGSIPQGAVRMQKRDVIEVLIRTVNSWKPKKEM